MDTASQAWITVAGLALDFVGFVLLLREWWIAFLSEHAVMVHEENLERQQKFRAFASQNANDALRHHMTRAGEMQDEIAIRRSRDERRAALRGRRAWFIAAGICIVLGSALQLFGALPF